MDARELNALAGLRFETAPTEKTLLNGRLPHVEGLNQPVYDRVRDELKALRTNTAESSPRGLVVHGEPGAGKSHLLWWARRLISGLNGYYFNIQPDGDPETLWTRVLGSMVRDLCEPLGTRYEQETPVAVSQLSIAIGRLAEALELPTATRDVLTGARTVAPEEARDCVRRYSGALRTRYPSQELRNVAVALVLMAIIDDDANAAGWAYFKDSAEELQTRREWGLRPTRPDQPQEVVRHLSTLLAISGPSLFVVDQIDELVGRSAYTTETAGDDTETGDLATALMTIREKLTRSVTVISCLDHTWRLIRRRATGSATDRFHEAMALRPIPSPQVGRDLVTTFLAGQFRDLGFIPPHPTWPIAPEAFDSVVGMRPRRLIELCEAHVRECVAAQRVLPLAELGDNAEAVEATPNTPPEVERTQQRYGDHHRSIHVDGLKETDSEKQLGSILTAAAQCLLVEAGVDGECKVDDTALGADRPSIHCELTGPEGLRVGVRGVNTVHAPSVGTRVDNARAFVFDGRAEGGGLLIVRTNSWNPTPRIRRVYQEIDEVNGHIASLSDEELRVLHAVQLTAGEDSAQTRDWLRHYRPVSDTAFGQRLLRMIRPEGTTEEPSPVSATGADNPAVSAEAPSSTVEPRSEDEPRSTDTSGRSDTPHSDPVADRNDTSIPLGRQEERTVSLDLDALRKHVAVFAASGSGKTVLLRRLIEECALRDVSTIVLDPNNDLARLGEAWPDTPPGWWSGDDALAADYLRHTDVVVWTPGVSKGNPLTLQPFPDFTAVRDDPDELRLAVDTAVASVAPRARIDGENHLADGRRAVLRETLSEMARGGGGDLDRLIDMLSDPPETVLSLPSAAKHASFVASALSYARANDPLLHSDGTPFDPDRLLTPAAGHRARVSVINLAGIPEENRPAFINRLQMTLFSWIKRNPAKDKPLSGLFVMDEAQTFIPSGRSTPCTESTRNLASQARKYGLGLVYATQAPRGIDSRITGNAASHIYGRVTVPAHVGAVREIARARAEEPPPVSKLGSGEFYASLEGRPLTRLTVPMCLSHHSSPLEEPEIAQRAARGSA